MQSNAWNINDLPAVCSVETTRTRTLGIRTSDCSNDEETGEGEGGGPSGFPSSALWSGEEGEEGGEEEGAAGASGGEEGEGGPNGKCEGGGEEGEGGGEEGEEGGEEGEGELWRH